MYANRKLLDEFRDYENIRMCIKLAILQGIRRMFPGLYGLLEIKSIITYGSSLDGIDDLRVLTRLLGDMFNDKELLKSMVRSSLSKLTKKSEDIANALLSEDDDRLYMTLSRLSDSAFWNSCRELLK